MNNVQLIGRLTKNVELKYTPSGIEVVQFVLAVNRNFTNQQGERDADFIRCVAYRKTAELIAKHFQKGSQLALSGRIQTGSYENQQGQRVYTTDVIVSQIYFVGNSSQRSQSEASDLSQNPSYFGSNHQNDINMPSQQINANIGGFGANTRYSDNVPDFITDDDLPF